MAELLPREEPSTGDLVIGIVKTVEKYGVYVTLLDHPGWEGFVHISEISLKWVRNIRDYLREGQKEVFKVIRVNSGLRQVDLSLRRVGRKEKEEKLLEWKRYEKAQRVVSLLADRTGMTTEEVRKMLVDPVAKRGMKLFDLFMEILEQGSVPEWLNLDAKTAQRLIDLVKQEIKVKRVVIKGELMLRCRGGDGVLHIRKAVEEALKTAGRNEQVSITTKGPPRYIIRVEAETEERARELLREASERCIAVIRERGGEGELVSGKS